jgi:hypothetical protein
MADVNLKIRIQLIQLFMVPVKSHFESLNKRLCVYFYFRNKVQYSVYCIDYVIIIEIILSFISIRGTMLFKRLFYEIY